MSLTPLRLKSALSLVVLGMIGTTANAATIQPLLENIGASGGNFDYTYRLELTPNNGLVGGLTHPSCVIIADFPSVVGVSISSVGADITAASDWSLFTPSTGAGTLPDWIGGGGLLFLNGFSGGVGTFDTADTNVVLQYTGGGVAVDFSQRQLLHLKITSSISPNFGVKQSLSRNSTLFVDNETNTFPVLTTLGGGIPEPASLGVLTIGTAALLMRRRR